MSEDVTPQPVAQSGTSPVVDLDAALTPPVVAIPANRFTLTKANLEKIGYSFVMTIAGVAVSYALTLIPQLDLSTINPQVAAMIPFIVSILTTVHQYLSPN